jgi:hypothetical protein
MDEYLTNMNLNTVLREMKRYLKDTSNSILFEMAVKKISGAFKPGVRGLTWEQSHPDHSPEQYAHPNAALNVGKHKKLAENDQKKLTAMAAAYNTFASPVLAQNYGLFHADSTGKTYPSAVKKCCKALGMTDEKDALALGDIWSAADFADAHDRATAQLGEAVKHLAKHVAEIQAKAEQGDIETDTEDEHVEPVTP